MTPRDVALCSSFAVVLPLGQSLFKWAAVYDQRLSGPLLARMFHNWPLMGAGAWYAMTAVLWFYILTRVPLSTAYAFSIVGSGLVPLVAWLVFKEPLGWRFAVGYALMLTGFLVILQGQPRG